MVIEKIFNKISRVKIIFFPKTEEFIEKGLGYMRITTEKQTISRKCALLIQRKSVKPWFWSI